MPPKSKAQERLMQAAAHDPAVAKKTGVPQDVAREFVAAEPAKGKAPKWGGPGRKRRTYTGA